MLACLPGSRDEELRRHLPLVMAVLAAPQLPACLPVIPLAPSLSIAQCCALTGLAAERLAVDLPCYRFGTAILVEGHSLAVLKLAAACVSCFRHGNPRVCLSGCARSSFLQDQPAHLCTGKRQPQH